MKISELYGDRAEAEVDFPAQTIVVGYRPWLVTPRYLEEATGRPVSAVLPEVLTDWPLQAADGSPIPLTVEALNDVPSEVQQAVWIGVLRARRPPLKVEGSTGD